MNLKTHWFLYGTPQLKDVKCPVCGNPVRTVFRNHRDKSLAADPCKECRDRRDAERRASFEADDGWDI